MEALHRETLAKFFVRPPRRTDYCTIFDLGQDKFKCGNFMYTRTDFHILNPRNQKLECSFFTPDRTHYPVVLYLHGNSGCRLDGMEFLPLLCTYGIGLFLVDLAGSGLSEGQYISLGHWEKEDVNSIITFLSGRQEVTNIAIIGRSMGAATALLYCAKYNKSNRVKCLVLDSPFCDLKAVAKDIVNHAVRVPGSMTSLGLKILKKHIKNLNDFKIKDVNPSRVVGDLKIPALFLHAENDDFVPPTHSQTLMAKYGGKCQLVMVKGDHNSLRTAQYYDEVSQFLFRNLLNENDKAHITRPIRIEGPHMANMKTSHPLYICQRLDGPQDPTKPLSVMWITSNSFRLTTPITEELLIDIPFRQVLHYRFEERIMSLKWKDEKGDKHYVRLLTGEDEEILRELENRTLKRFEKLKNSIYGLDTEFFVHFDAICKLFIRQYRLEHSSHNPDELRKDFDSRMSKIFGSEWKHMKVHPLIVPHLTHTLERAIKKEVDAKNITLREKAAKKAAKRQAKAQKKHTRKLSLSVGAKKKQSTPGTVHPSTSVSHPASPLSSPFASPRPTHKLSLPATMP